MNYLKTISEVTSYCLRDVEVPDGQETQYSNIASRMIDEYCGRSPGSLSIGYHLVDFELTSGQIGHVPIKPILSLVPTELVTGVRIRALGYGRETLGDWTDVTIADPLSDTINLRTGRMQLSAVTADFGRSASQSSASRYLIEMEVLAGFFVDTTLADSALINASTVELESVAGVKIGKTLQFNVQPADTSITDYRVTSVDTTTKIVGITPNLAVALASGVTATEKIPEDVKFATAVIIEDRLTFQPSTLRQTETLDVLTDRLSRMGVFPVPMEAQRLLGKYRT